MTQPLPPLHRSYLNMLVHFHEAGGPAEPDQHGRLTVGPSRHFLPGDAVAWQKIAAYGYIAGVEDVGKFVVTEAGRKKAEEVIASRTRTATF